MDDAYAEATAGGTVDLSKVPKYSEYKTVMHGRCRDPVTGREFGIEGHHVDPEKWVKELYLRVHGRLPTNAELDNIPTLIMPRVMHNTGQGLPGTATFHDLLRARLPLDPSEYTKAQILEGLQQTYQQFNGLYGGQARFDYNRVWSVGREWLRLQGIE